MNKVSFCIVFPERSGSTFLVELLNNHPEITCYHEEFEATRVPGQKLRVAKYTDNQKVSNMIRKIYVDSPTKANGFKFKFPTQFRVYPQVVEYLEDSFEDLKIIFLYRRNRLKAAVSSQNLKRLYALEKPHYLSGDSSFSIGKLLLNIPKAFHYVKIREKSDFTYFQEFYSFKQKRVVAYEDLLENPFDVCKSLFEYLEVDSSFVPKVKTKKITSDDLREALANYSQLEKRARLSPLNRYL